MQTESLIKTKNKKGVQRKMTTFLIGVLATVGAEAAALIIVLIVCACKVAGRADHGTDGKR